MSIVSVCWKYLAMLGSYHSEISCWKLKSVTQKYLQDGNQQMPRSRPSTLPTKSLLPDTNKPWEALPEMHPRVGTVGKRTLKGMETTRTKQNNGGCLLGKGKHSSWGREPRDYDGRPRSEVPGEEQALRKLMSVLNVGSLMQPAP